MRPFEKCHRIKYMLRMRIQFIFANSLIKYIFQNCIDSIIFHELMFVEHFLNIFIPNINFEYYYFREAILSSHQQVKIYPK